MWGGFALLMMDNGEPREAEFAMRQFQDAIESSDGAVTERLHLEILCIGRRYTPSQVDVCCLAVDEVFARHYPLAPYKFFDLSR